jgi:hypothetical protein
MVRSKRVPLDSLSSYSFPQTFRISWSTGSVHGHGEFFLNAVTAKDWVKYLSTKHQDMLHWSEDKDMPLQSPVDSPVLHELESESDMPDLIPLVEDNDVFVPEFDDYERAPLRVAILEG